MKKINEKLNLYGDNIAKVEQYDFSMANSSDEARTLAITSIATICTQKFDSIGSEKLCTKLLTEAHGIPSSAYGFVPVLINEYLFSMNLLLFGDKNTEDMNVYKFGQKVENGKYLLTNLRALVNDIGLEASKEFYNTDPNEIAIIKKYFKVFKHKMDIRSARQFMRHSTAVWQELSRRYVSGERVPFEHYVSNKMKEVLLFDEGVSVKGSKVKTCFTAQDIIDISLKFYKQALEQGVKPQEARRIIPQAAYTQIWGAFMPKQLDNYFKLRLDESSQWEIRQTAIAMQELIIDERK